MKYIRIILLLITLLLFSSATQQSPIYQHLGSYNMVINQYNNTNVSVSAYVTKHYNNVNNMYGYKYVYYLKMRSHSHNAGTPTSTWLYGTRVYINNSEVSAAQSPYGFTMLVRTTETIVYTWYTSEESLNFGVKWDNAVYDPRNIR